MRESVSVTKIYVSIENIKIIIHRNMSEKGVHVIDIDVFKAEDRD